MVEYKTRRGQLRKKIRSKKIRSKKIRSKKIRSKKKGGGIGIRNNTKCENLTKKTLSNKNFTNSKETIYDKLVKYLVTDGTDTGIKNKVTLVFPKEECIKNKTQDKCKPKKVCSFTDKKCINNHGSEYDGLIDIISLINDPLYNTDEDKSITTIIEKLNNFIRLAFTDNNNVKIDLEWSDFVTNHKDCGYNYFRKLVVDISIVFIILNLFHGDNIILKKGDSILYESHESHQSQEHATTIVYEMAGSEDTTSDYDVSIYSYPPNSKISSISSIFNWAFKQALEKTPDIIFDTNLYTHPIYLFKNNTANTANTANTDKGLFIPLSETKYILNSGNEAFYKNELLYSNLLYYEGAHHESLKSQLTFKTAFVSGGTIPDQWSSKDNNYATMSIITEDKNTSNTDNTANTAKPDKCVRERIVGSQNCKDDMNEVIVKRQEYDQKPIPFLTNFYNNGMNGMNENNIKEQYISPMRVSLWYADETYHTYSAYFHVIHCCAMNTHPESINAITWLLKDDNNIEAFKNICRVSMLENYAFMFHYLKQGTSIKKIAKYLARISHAAAIIETKTKVDDLTGKMNNYGNYNYIIQKYKRGDDTAVRNNEHQGILKHNIEIPNINSIDFLKKIYDIMIKPEYGIDKGMFCFDF
jgi:hypothetical protein